MSQPTLLQARFAAALRTTPDHANAAKALALATQYLADATARAARFPGDDFWAHGMDHAASYVAFCQRRVESADFWAEAAVQDAEYAAQEVALGL